MNLLHRGLDHYPCYGSRFLMSLLCRIPETDFHMTLVILDPPYHPNSKPLNPKPLTLYPYTPKTPNTRKKEKIPQTLFQHAGGSLEAMSATRTFLGFSISIPGFRAKVGFRDYRAYRVDRVDRVYKVDRVYRV